MDAEPGLRRASSLSFGLHAAPNLFRLVHTSTALETLHEHLDRVKVARLHDGGVVVAIHDWFPDLRRRLAEFVELAHMFGTACGGSVMGTVSECG